jgi:hypothetical protein
MVALVHFNTYFVETMEGWQLDKIRRTGYTPVKVLGGGYLYVLEFIGACT